MNKNLSFILAVGIAIVAIALYEWDRNSDTQASVEQVESGMPEFTPRRKAFKLDDGTPCVMVWAPNRSQSSGISCDWDWKSRSKLGT